MKEQVRQKAFTLSTEEGIVSNEFIVKTAFRNKTNQHLETIISRSQRRSQSDNLRFKIFFLQLHISSYTLKSVTMHY